MKNLVLKFQNRFSPLQQLLILGLFFRLIAVFFSKGFGWHDDHFLIIEPAQNWADGFDNNWLPSETHPNQQPQGHSLFYIGLHYYLFIFCKAIGIYDPQIKMLIVRFLHALWSLLIITYSYKITKIYANEKTAWYVGLFMSLYWFMPFMSVRNLVEFVCVPPTLIAIHLLLRKEITWKNFVMAGLWLGVAFSIRFQSIFITAGIGLALLLNKTAFKHILLLSLSFLLVVFLTQGLVDYIIWKRPFAEFIAYVDYNIQNANAYGSDNWHMYFDLIFGLLIPPLSFLLFAGYFYSWKKAAFLFWPVFLYLAFHSYFPNRQERFVMTVLPLLIISGTIGMFDLYERYKSKFNRGVFKFSKLFVIVLNSVLLLVLSTSYSKRHRVEAMYYLYQKNDSNSFIVEDSNKDSDFLMPALYYYGKWPSVIGITKAFPVDSALKQYQNLPAKEKPKYIVFWQAENIEARVDSVKKRFPGLEYETTIQPSLIDKTLYWMNPLNDNQTSYIYKIN